jgi:hypothetical protein
MAGNFVKYASDPLTAADLPVDGHLLIALCAPRPVLITVGSNTGPVGNNTQGDWWADPTGKAQGRSGRRRRGCGGCRSGRK